MLRDVYVQVGLGWTLAIGAIVMLTAITWLVAMAGAVVRPMGSRRRVALVALLTLLPPSALLVLTRFIYASRSEYRDSPGRASAQVPHSTPRVTMRRRSLGAAA